jgi:hypothetical protein
MSGYCELEVSVDAVGDAQYRVHSRFRRPGADETERTGSETLPIDLAALEALRDDDAGYGRALGAALFGATEVGKKLAQARAVAAGEDGLRLRLAIDSAAEALHGLRWETLREPSADTPLATRSDLLFSRYLANPHVRPSAAPARDEVRALLVVANPVDLASWELAPIDVEGEIADARRALGNVYVDTLSGPGAATLERIVEKLGEGFDILYLVCHGAVRGGRPLLWLDDGEGLSARVSGQDFARAFDEMPARPRLVVLASCQSAGTGGSRARDGGSSTRDGGALAALGPRLAHAGVPAVLAMQGNISIATARAFMPRFFAELMRDGQVDRAMAVARALVGDAPDWWAPALFMRLESGRLWMGHGGKAIWDKFPALVAEITADPCNCIPVLGPALPPSLFGSLRDIASRMAARHDFALAPDGRDDLAQVAQYLAYRQSGKFARKALADFLKTELLQRQAARVPEELRRDPATVKLDDLVSAIGARLRADDPDNPHARLARCPFPIYVTTGRDNLLRDALREAGKHPRSLIARWRRFEGIPAERFYGEPGFSPSVREPVVLHVFGNLELPETLVVSQDDYFDFLVGITQRQANTDAPGLPHFLSSQLSSSGLLFLGFQVDDWDFRILYRTIRLHEGMQNRLDDDDADLTRVAVQIDPEEGASIEPYGARRYLEEFFRRTTETSIVWGSTDAFVAELARQLGGDK